MARTVNHNPLTQFSACALAREIASGQVSALEAVEAHIAQIEQVNGALNALVANRFELARAEAQHADAHRAAHPNAPLPPLHGVPITVKESLAVAGMPQTYGVPSRAQALATADAPYVARLRDAGAIVLGVTNVPQLLASTECANPLYGRSNNPWNIARTPGGSSGGEAALIAAGASPLGLGSDTGGSIRIPAAHCGVAGFKPTAGRTPVHSTLAMPPGQHAIVSQVGALARDVDDLIVAIEALNGGREPATEPPQPLGDARAVDISTLRVAYYMNDDTFVVAPAVRRAVVEAAGMLAGRGAQVSEWRPPNVQEALDIFIGVLVADGGQSARRVLAHNQRDPALARLLRLAAQPGASVALLRAILTATGQGRTAHLLRAFGRNDTANYLRVIAAQQEYRRRFAHALDTDDGGPFDLIICPAYPLPAPQHGATRDLLTGGGYAPLYNVLGYPAGVVPVTRVRPGEETLRKRSFERIERAAYRAEAGSAGLPIGVQIVARPWRDHVALAAMGVVQDAARAQPNYPVTPHALA